MDENGSKEWLVTKRTDVEWVHRGSSEAQQRHWGSFWGELLKEVRDSFPLTRFLQHHDLFLMESTTTACHFMIGLRHRPSTPSPLL